MCIEKQKKKMRCSDQYAQWGPIVYSLNFISHSISTNQNTFRVRDIVKGYRVHRGISGRKHSFFIVFSLYGEAKKKTTKNEMHYSFARPKEFTINICILISNWMTGSSRQKNAIESGQRKCILVILRCRC